MLHRGYLVTGPGPDGVYGTGNDDVMTTLPGYQQQAIYSVIAGGSGNALYDSSSAAIGGGNANTIEPYANYSVIAGGSANRITYASGYSVISGGTENAVMRGAGWGTIGGGQENLISGALPSTNYFISTNVASGSLLVGHQYRVVATGGTVTHNSVTYSDGQYFIASGTTFSTSGTAFVVFADDGRHWGWIGGGWRNLITNKGDYLTQGRAGVIAGGLQNLVSANVGTIGGGWTNGVAGDAATVPGGSWNHADGANSFAAGRHAHADHDGSFVWADYNPNLDTEDSGTYRDVRSPNTNTFSVRASGGFWFGAGKNNASIPAGRLINTSSGAYLTTAGMWTSVSDRNAKEKFNKIDAKKVLEKVASLPIQEWKYKVEDDSVRHIGPIAQDFYAAFALGSDDRAIGAVDADGVALAAIQGLNLVLEEKNGLIAAQAEQIRSLEERFKRIESRLAD